MLLARPIAEAERKGGCAEAKMDDIIKGMQTFALTRSVDVRLQFEDMVGLAKQSIAELELLCERDRY
jgi:hypothetical protein